MNAAGAIAKRAAVDAQRPDVLSVREVGGNNRGEYVEKYQKAGGGGPGDAWCAFFLYYRLLMAALALGLKLPKTFTPRGYTPDWRIWAILNKCWTTVADAMEAPMHRVQVGDAALFYIRSLGRIGHIGIVIEVHSWGVVTVEGNTKAEAGVSRDSQTGDGVFVKKREWAELGSRGGFVRLPF